MVDLEKVSEELKNWEVKNAKDLQRVGEYINRSGIPIKIVYTPLDVKDLDYLKDLSFPGEYPFTRGVYPTMYRGRLWTIRQYAGFGTAEDTNKRYKYLISQGQTGLSVAFHLPTQCGYDSDHPMAFAEIGKVGVAIDSLKDMEILFDGINLGKITTSMTINSTCPQVLAMYFCVASSQGVPDNQVGGTVQNDILKEYVARGTYIYPPEPSMRLVGDVIEWCYKNAPRFNSISVSGYHMREAGCTAVQEAAFTLANGIAYIDHVVKRGIPVDNFAPRVSFFFAAQRDLFEEVAKFRAMRRMWAKIMKERFGAKNPRSMLLRFHVQTAGVTLTAQQPYVNLLRNTLEALAAVLGGAQSLHVNSFDEAYATPTEFAVTLSVRTQQIIAYESKVTATVDPLGGSYYVEWLTDQIEEKAMEYIHKIDDMGGAPQAIEKGFYQREIADAAYQYQKDVESKREIVVGVNEFVTGEEIPVTILKVDPEVRKRQIERLKKVKSERDNVKVKDALANLRRSAEKGENIIPATFEAIRAYATIGETSDVLREVFGEYRASTII
ncbi:MAG: methylmalonyl-CoA mutase [Candidatus Hecatellales archaeon]|nr:MAG: methylmalonyl-CoA mutase [Candidatus Hecatellales archaeon]